MNDVYGEKSENTSAIAVTQIKGNCLRLTKLHSRKDLSFDKKEMATPEKINEWEYLKSITKEMMLKMMMYALDC